MMGSKAEPLSVEHKYDVLIIGGGAAGLSAALVLGRARRRVIVIDDGSPRNLVAEFSHGYLTRDGVRPADLLRFAREELAAYPTIQFLRDSASNVVKRADDFVLTVACGKSLIGQRLLMATGVFDQLPVISGLQERWGKSVFVCPFCDGWEVRDRRIAVYGPGREAVELAQELRGWTDDLIVCVEHDDLTERDRRWIQATQKYVVVR